MIDGKTKVCGIIANPVEHTMSPLLQNLYAERSGNNFIYVPFKVESQDVEAAVKGAYAMNLVGMNVTVPHKQTVMRFLKEIDENAEAIGAVNTLVRMEGGYKGYNTDASGLLRAMNEAGISVKGRPCILLGAGGAAKAAAYILAKEGAAVIYNLNRNQERGRELCSYINQVFGQDLMKAMDLKEYNRLPREKYLAVQTTSVGMHPNTDAAIIEDKLFYQLVDQAVDIVYTPSHTKFMRYVEEAGGKAFNGLDMLLYQGVTAYELWNPHVKIKQEVISEAREIILRQLEGR